MINVVIIDQQNLCSKNVLLIFEFNCGIRSFFLKCKIIFNCNKYMRMLIFFLDVYIFFYKKICKMQLFS